MNELIRNLFNLISKMIFFDTFFQQINFPFNIRYSNNFSLEKSQNSSIIRPTLVV